MLVKVHIGACIFETINYLIRQKLILMFFEGLLLVSLSDTDFIFSYEHSVYSVLSYLLKLLKLSKSPPSKSFPTCAPYFLNQRTEANKLSHHRKYTNCLIFSRNMSQFVKETTLMRGSEWLKCFRMAKLWVLICTLIMVGKGWHAKVICLWPREMEFCVSMGSVEMLL